MTKLILDDVQNNRDTWITFRISAEDRRMLQYLAIKLDVNRSELIRRWIAAQYGILMPAQSEMQENRLTSLPPEAK